MIIKIEYFMDDIFGDKVLYYIEKKDDFYYFSNKKVNARKINNEETLSFIEKLLLILERCKKSTNIVIIDEPIGYIKIIKENGEELLYSSENYLLGNIDELLRQFESRVMNFELE